MIDPMNKDTLYTTKRMPRWRRRIIYLLVLVLLAVLVFRLSARSIGEYLVLEDQTQKADVIVVLGGSAVVRALAAAERYKEGLAPLVYASRGFMARADLVQDIDLRDTGNWGLTLRILKEKGVPEEAVYMDQPFVSSTIAEARRMKTFMEDRDFSSLILITSAFHSRRAAKTFARILGPDYKIISLPSRYDPFNAEHWWRDRSSAKMVVLEYQKMLFMFIESMLGKGEDAATE